ncbi:ABC transporter permease [Mangrovicoccus algicola]|uniref:ABC transporter permease subunit n=1 Tax=Mangrovicoccus algicola TaxID=2771008 RepID=A0A8J6YY30_9RHOB|nr:ABC transporter permease subunit [Mangrovicoccus algicola]MBE3639877.1 ABC transporter permease subunit [Mangrovicoccus algicola]
MTAKTLPLARLRLLPPGGPGAGLPGLVIALGSMLVIWQLGAIAVRPWIPTPADTAVEIWANLQSPEFWLDFRLTLARVLGAFALATLAGAAVGILIGLSERAEAFFQPLLALALAVPDPVYIIFAILAFGTGEVAGFVALTVAVTPFVSNIVRSSVRARDTGLDEMARIYRLPRAAALRHQLLPQLVPALLTAARFSFALSWKLAVVVEAIGQPDGIGASIFESFRLLRMREVAATAIIFILAMQLLERGVLGRVEKRLLGWRG